eukprot:7283907-Pyramimonas_sp.AAC.1
MFNGRHYRQDEQHNFHATMTKFIGERLAPIKVSKGHGAHELCSPGECSQARAVLGLLNWLTRELRVDGSGRCSLLQQALRKLTYEDVKEINQLVKYMKDTAELGITAWSIPLNEIIWMSISDA